MSPLAAGNATIPPIIWMTWRSIDSVPNKVYAGVRRFAPEYKLRLLDDARTGNLCCQALRRASIDLYKNLRTAAHRADLWRYCALYHFGGVYLDVKTWLIRPMREIFPTTAVNTAYTVLAARL